GQRVHAPVRLERKPAAITAPRDFTEMRSPVHVTEPDRRRLTTRAHRVLHVNVENARREFRKFLGRPARGVGPVEHMAWVPHETTTVRCVNARPAKLRSSKPPSWNSRVKRPTTDKSCETSSEMNVNEGEDMGG